jgi:hypothetical protein
MDAVGGATHARDQFAQVGFKEIEGFAGTRSEIVGRSHRLGYGRRRHRFGLCRRGGVPAQEAGEQSH